MGLCAPNDYSDNVSFKKEEEKMIDDNQKKIIIEQLECRMTTLESKKISLTRGVASYGSALNKVLEEIVEIEDVLLDLKRDNDDYRSPTPLFYV